MQGFQHAIRKSNPSPPNFDAVDDDYTIKKKISTLDTRRVEERPREE